MNTDVILSKAKNLAIQNHTTRNQKPETRNQFFTPKHTEKHGASIQNRKSKI